MKKLMLSLVLLPVLSASAGTVTVLSSTKTGSTSEETTYVDSGKWAGRVAFLDANEVLVTGAAAEGGSVKGKGLCKDIQGEGNAYGHLKCPRKATQVAFAFETAAGWNPRGLAFIPGANEFVINDLERLTAADGRPYYNYPLLFVDEDGHTLRRVEVQHAPDLYVHHVEGLDYVPPADPGGAGRLAMVAFTESPGYPLSNIAIVGLDGVVEHYIPLWDEAFMGGIAGVAVLGEDRFLVSPYSGLLYEVNLAGEIVAGPFPVSEAASLEAVDFYPDGRLFAADYGYGKAWTFDASYQRLPEEDLSFGPALALARPVAVMEDPASSDLLVYAFPETVYRVKRDLSAKSVVVPLRETPVGVNAPSVSVIPETGQLAVAHNAYWAEDGSYWNRSVSHVTPPNGTSGFAFQEGFRLPLPVGGRLYQLEYVPTTRELLVLLRSNLAGPDNRARIFVFTHEGAYLRSVDLPFFIRGITFMAPRTAGSPGTLLVNEAGSEAGKAHVVGLDGTVLETHDFPAGTSLSGIVQDESDAGGRSFIGVNPEDSQLVRFQLP